MESSVVISFERELAESLLDEIVDTGKSEDSNMTNFFRKNYANKEIGAETVFFWPLINRENVFLLKQFLNQFPRRAWYMLQYFEEDGIVWESYGSGYIFLDHIPKLEMVW